MGVFMASIPMVLSLLLVLSTLISLFLGSYVIGLNPKRGVNRAFLALCLSLSIWSLGFALANSASGLETALLWRRFSSIGMTSLFGVILHFLLLITREKQAEKAEWNLFFLHIPAFVCMYIFAFSSDMAELHYKLIWTDYGLVNIAPSSLWHYFYYSYYSIYMTIALVVVWNWKKRLNNKVKIRQANFIFIAMLVSFVFASLTDILANSFLTRPIPQIAPLFIILPIWTMYYSARHYDLIGDEKLYKEEVIVTEKEKQKIFHTIAIVFCIGGILSFMLDSGIRSQDIKSLMYFVTATVIYLIQKIKKEKLKEALTIIVLVVNIPIITFRYLENASITVWVFPLIIILASLVFSKKTLLISTVIVSIITQRLIWILRPEQLVVVDKYDYILRVILFLTALVVGYYVNRMYVAKLKENDYQMKFQIMNANISSDFITINKDNVDEKINGLLCEMGMFFGADRTYLFLIDYEDHTMTYSHEWCNTGIAAEVETIENIPLTTFPWWIKELQSNKLVYIEDTSTMPEEAINEQAQLLRQKVKSLVCVPGSVKSSMKT